MNFRASFCDLFNPKIIEIGQIDRDRNEETFEKIPWKDMLHNMMESNFKDNDYSASREIEYTDNNYGLTFATVDETEWYIFFQI